MAEVSIKPLRKPEALLLSNNEYKAKVEKRHAASELLLRRDLGDRFENLAVGRGLIETFSTRTLFRSARIVGDYVCNILNTALVSDEAGRIADILLTVPPFVDPEQLGRIVDPSDERHLQTLIGLLNSSDTSRHFTMLCQPDQVQPVKSWFSALHIPDTNFSVCISTFNYSIWAQDAYVALSDQAGQPILCEGVHFPRYDDPTIADDVSAQTNKSALQSYLYFQGGNVLEAGDYVLIGKDYIEENLGRAFLETEEKVLKAFQSLFGKEVISVGRDDVIPDADRKYLGGGYFQPIFHIDMYVTPTGKKTRDGKDIVAVASPRLGRDAVGERSEQTDLDIYFDEAADQLSAYFHVERMPILPAYIKYRTKQGVKERYYYLSFNNAVLENYGGKSNVYLPTFSDDVQSYLSDTSVLEYQGDAKKRQALDLAAKSVWEDKLGFTAYQMDGLEDLAIGWGSVHCITKTLVRTR